MKHILDQEKTLKKLDPDKVYDSITMFPVQLKEAWEEASIQTIKGKFTGINKVCIVGMGGSALAGRIIEHLSPALTSLPVFVSSNYRLPAWVDSSTLVMVSSYSGNTEETVSSFQDAIVRKAKIFVIASGGKLEQLAIKNNLNIFRLDTKRNPSGMPRLALGSSLGAHLGLLQRLNVLKGSELDIDSISGSLNNMASCLSNQKNIKNNPAKILANKTKGKSIVIFSANHLNGSAYAAKNQINESAKTFSVNFHLPDINHHLLEGLSLPKPFKQLTHFILLNSESYPQKIKDRLLITKEVLTKQGYPVTIIKPESTSMVDQALETILFFEYFSFYLAMVSNVNPGPIPWVDYFKKRLESPLQIK
jgi:glucose/mannose-6-phosphate isomerase